MSKEKRLKLTWETLAEIKFKLYFKFEREYIKITINIDDFYDFLMSLPPQADGQVKEFYDNLNAQAEFSIIPLEQKIRDGLGFYILGIYVTSKNNISNPFLEITEYKNRTINILEKWDLTENGFIKRINN